MIEAPNRLEAFFSFLPFVYYNSFIYLFWHRIILQRLLEATV